MMAHLWLLAASLCVATPLATAGSIASSHSPRPLPENPAPLHVRHHPATFAPSAATTVRFTPPHLPLCTARPTNQHLGALQLQLFPASALATGAEPADNTSALRPLFDTGRLPVRLPVYHLPHEPLRQQLSTQHHHHLAYRLRAWTHSACAPSAWSPLALLTLPPASLPSEAKAIWAAGSSALYAQLRAELTLPSAPVAASAFITAAQDGDMEKLLGAYQLFVNGRMAAVGPGRGGTTYAAPNHTNFDTVDLLPVMAGLADDAGASLVLGIQGYHHDSASAKIRAQFVFAFADGSSLVLNSSASSFSGRDATAFFNPTGTTGGAYKQPRENQDAHHAADGWTQPGFGQHWPAAVEQPDFPIPVTPKPTAPLHISEGVQPTQVTQLSSGHWFFDFGTELMAGLRLEVPGGAAADGWVLQMVLGEELSAPNTVMYPMRTGNTYANTFTLRNGVSVFQHHEYMLFRYGELRFLNASVQCGVAEENSALELSCAGGQTISAVTFASYGTPGGSCGSSFSVNSSCNAASSAKVVEGLCLGKPRCTITASNSVFGGDPCHLTAKRLAAAVTCSAGRRADGAASPAPAAPSLNFTLTAWQVQYPWNESESHFSSSSPMLNQVYELCRNTLRVTSLDTFTDSNTRERLPYEADQFITAHSRSVFQRSHLLARHSARHNILNPTWPTEWRQTTPLLALADYMATGELELYEDFAELLLDNSQARCLNPSLGLVDFRKCARQDGTRDVIDWPQASRDGYVLSDVSTVISAYGLGALTALSQLAGAAGNSSQAAALAATAASIRTGMRTHLLSSSSGLFTDGLDISHSAFQASTFPLWLGAVNASDPADSAAALAFLKDKGMAGSVYAAYSLLHGLYRSVPHDLGQTALSFLTSCATNSWCTMLKHNATATMEAWTTEEKPNLSWSHPWATAPASAIAEGVMGVRATAPGFRQLLVRPQPGNLSSAEMLLPTMAGDVVCSFEQTADNFVLTLSVPVSCEAKVCLPAVGSTAASLVVDGKPTPAVLEIAGAYACVDNIGSSAKPHTISRK